MCTPLLYQLAASLARVLLLVENHGRILEKEKLIEEVWPDTVVEEGNLASNIYMLRKALGEGTNGQQYIQTIPRRGYRFVAEVREVVAEDVRQVVKEPVELHLVTRQQQDAVLPQRAITASGRASLENKWKLALAAVALLVVTAAVFFYWTWSRPNPSVKTIAVLPFKPLASDSRDESLELGMADTLINKLSGIRQIIVRPLTAVRKYSALDQDPVAAGRELEPTSALRNRNVAIRLYYLRRYDEAIEQCLKALELDDDMPTTYRWLAQSYEKKRLYDQAVESYLKTAEFGPEGDGYGQRRPLV